MLSLEGESDAQRSGALAVGVVLAFPGQFYHWGTSLFMVEEGQEMLLKPSRQLEGNFHFLASVSISKMIVKIKTNSVTGRRRG